MARSILIVLLSILSVFTSVNAAPKLCTDVDNTISIMEECYTTFCKSYGIDNPFPLAGFFTANSFHEKRTAMLEDGGITAKPAMEDYGVTLTKCLANIENCIEDSTYEQPGLGAQKDDGHRYNTDRLITAYQTSDRGYELQMRHFYCLRACGEANEAATDKCDADLAAIEKPTCDDYSTNMQCYKNIFTECCGPEGGEFQCNSVGAEYKIFMKDDLASGKCTFAPCS